jgi:hypothetical protein
MVSRPALDSACRYDESTGHAKKPHTLTRSGPSRVCGPAPFVALDPALGACRRDQSQAKDDSVA